MIHLVTGGAGYFGEVLVRHLLAKNLKVRVLDLNPLQGFPKDTVEMIIGDIRDPQCVKRACEGVSYIHHNVAQVPLAKDRHLFDSVNIEGTRTILETALALQVKKFVYTSSSAIYGVPKHLPVTETTLPQPAEAYGRAKLSGEFLCQDYINKGMDITIIRPRTILGHGRLGIFQILFEWIYCGWNIPVLGKGDNIYQFIHADDLADACLRAAFLPGPNDFNIGTDRFGTMRETLNALIQYAGKNNHIRSLPMGLMEFLMGLASKLHLSPLGPYHALLYGRSLFFDTSKAKEQLNWSAKYSNSEALIQTYEWYCGHREGVLQRHNTSAHRSAVKQGVLKLMRFLP